jgi:hypothetical protein
MTKKLSKYSGIIIFSNIFNHGFLNPQMQNLTDTDIGTDFWYIKKNMQIIY